MCCFSPVSLPAWRRLFSFPFSTPIKVSGTHIYGRLADLTGLPRLFEILESLMSPFTLLPASREAWEFAGVRMAKTV